MFDAQQQSDFLVGEKKKTEKKSLNILSTRLLLHSNQTPHP